MDGAAFNESTEQAEQQHPETNTHGEVHKGVGADERRKPQDKNDTELRENWRRHAEAERRGGESGGGEGKKTELTNV